MFYHMKSALRSNVPSSEKLVLLVYADHANKQGIAWPGNRRIAEVTGLSLSTVKRAKKNLRQQGYLRSITGSSTRYKVVVCEPTGGSHGPEGAHNDTPTGVHSEPQKLPEEATMEEDKKKG